ncbi:MAG: arsenate reductase (glutaredoxin) [Proteobacteria bacterium]|nr:arsenate reductase (glutaredoxin) [Pseudomonadota bacterium]MDA1057696.1 arsenate reductase (glutaredoxin) [Pseudomonadota bacterium]
MTVTIYHNPRCTKSRQTLALLEDKGLRPTIVEYLKAPPSAKELEAILSKLGMEPRQLMRTKEEPYAALGLADLGKSRASLVKAMVENPILIERPIVLAKDKAAIGRPPENVLKIL